MYYVYALFRPDNGELFYIGAGSGNRAWAHISQSKYFNAPKDNLIREIISKGYDDLIVKIIKDDLSREEASDLEKSLIYAIGRQPHGPLLNRQSGGLEKFENHTDTKNQISSTMKVLAKNRIGTEWEKNRVEATRSSDARLKRSVNSKGKSKPWFKGKPKSQEHLEKLLPTRCGRQWINNGSIENLVYKREAIPNGWNRGRLPFSSETKANQSKAQFRRNNRNPQM